VTRPDGSAKVLAEVRRIGIVSQMVDPENPAEIVKVNISERKPVRTLSLATSNYTEPSPISTSCATCGTRSS